MIASIAPLMLALVGAVEPFAPGDVRLLPGPFERAWRAELAYFRTIDPERLMVPMAGNLGGQPLKAQYGGWEGGTGGAALGFWLSAAARYAAQGADDLRAPVERTVARLAALQRADGYLGRWPEERFAAVFDGSFTLDPIGGEQQIIRGLGLPFYVIDKELAGLLDVHEALGNAQALDVAAKMATWIARGVGRLSEAQQQRLLLAEHGGMAAAMAELGRRTGREDLAQAAQAWRQKALIEPLRAGRDALAGRHANSTIPKAIGEAALEPAVARTFWRMVTSHHAYAIGGVGYDEHFLDPDKLPLGSLVAESCATYNLLKLHARLFAQQPDARAADFAERALVNHLLAAVDPANGQSMYHVSMRPGHFKVYSTPEDSFWCCTTSGWENPTRYAEAAWFHAGNDLWLCQYLASRLTWTQAGLTLRLETDFPAEDRATLVVERAPDRPLTLHLRQPAWAGAGFAARLQGQRLGQVADGWLTLTRTWRAGERLTLDLPMGLSAERRPDDPNSVVLRCGPTVLAGALGRANYPASDQVRDQVSLVSWPSVEPPTLVSESGDPADWVKAVPGRPLTFRTVAAQPSAVDLVPFWQLHHQRYTLYWTLTSPARYAAEEPLRGLREAVVRRPGEVVVDEVRIGEAASEQAHGFNQRGSHSGPFWWAERALLHWRDAPDGWFEYRLATAPTGATALGVTYWGADSGRRWFDILAAGQVVATVRLDRNWGDQMHEEWITLPAAITRGKPVVTIRFAARPGHNAGGVYGLRTARL